MERDLTAVKLSKRRSFAGKKDYTAKEYIKGRNPAVERGLPAVKLSKRRSFAEKKN
ncbi:MAG TPA: hypothetical protein VK108_10010 [Pseudogracilibacillus sp.]|nr:hypothetical protein [Pseudogracilibacillus sp.]